MVKICKKCKKEKDESEYHKNNQRKDGLSVWCKICRCAADHKYRLNNKETISKRGKKYYIKSKNKIRERVIKKQYNITLDQYNQMLLDQNNKCKGCGIDLNLLIGRDSSICIDHCHKTNKVRGLLCYSCNLSLGLLNEDPERIRKLSKYAEYCKNNV